MAESGKGEDESREGRMGLLYSSTSRAGDARK